MKRLLLIFTFFSVFAGISNGQDVWRLKRIEVVGSLGATQYFGDIGGFTPSKNILGFKDISFRQTRFNLNTQARYRISRVTAAKISLAYGIFHATDDRGSNEGRGMESTTSFFEPALIGEFYFIKSKFDNSYLFSKGRKVPLKSLFSYIDMYAFSGLGGINYTVKGSDELVALGLPDKGFSAVIPAGIGINLLFNRDYNLGIELGGRYSFTDYLDGYTSQYSKSNDVYYFLNFTFTYKVPTDARGIPDFLNSRRRR